jgi:hypothetical protein
MKTQTNVDLVKDFMDFGHQGAVNQMFVVEALTKWSEIVIKNQAKLRKDMKDGFISADAWIACAKEWQKKSKAFYAHPRCVREQVSSKG